MAITIRQVVTYRRRHKDAARRATVLDEAVQLPFPGGGVEDEAIWHLYMSDQRRQVLEAARWLDPAFRTLLSLWWQENAGWLTREELAASCGISVAHAGVRLQRMREQLETSRSIVAALGVPRGCSSLAELTSRWGGQRTPVWRKRIARHVRDCPACSARALGQAPADRLLTSIAPLAVPAGLAALTGRLPRTVPVAPSPHRLRGARLGHAAAAHPLASAAAAVLLAGGTVTATYLTRPAPAHPAPLFTVTATASAPSAVPGTAVHGAATPAPAPSAASGVPLGPWSFESVAFPGEYLTSTGIEAALGTVTASSPLQDRQAATFTVVRGLADRRCVSFVASSGDYLRHYELRLRLSPDDGTPLFRKDATFCPHPGAVPGSVTLQSVNYPYLVIRYRGGGIYIDVSNGTAEFAAESSFFVGHPWS